MPSVFDAIETSLNQVIDSVKTVLKPEKILGKTLDVPLIKQAEVKLPKGQENEYCFFTALTMILMFKKGEKIDINKLNVDCIAMGGVRSDGYILDVNLICKATGQDFKWVSEVASADKIKKQLESYRPCVITLSDGHKELICGYEIIEGAVRFKINDPGYQNDQFADEELKPYRIEKGKKVYTNRYIVKIGYLK